VATQCRPRACQGADVPGADTHLAVGAPQPVPVSQPLKLRIKLGLDLHSSPDSCKATAAAAAAGRGVQLTRAHDRAADPELLSCFLVSAQLEVRLPNAGL
jgi:hypothetical protein